MKKLHSHTLSITSQILLVLIVLVLPLNVFCIISARNSQNVLTEHAVENVKTVVANAYNDLESRMDESASSIYSLLNDTRSTAFVQQSGDSDYINSKFYVANQLYDRMTFSAFSADVYVIYSPRLDDLLVCKNSDFLFYRPDLYEHIRDGSLSSSSGKWMLYDFDEKQWLINLSLYNGMYIGRMFCVDETIAEIKSLLPYQNIDVYLSDTLEDKPGNRFIVSVKSSVPYYFNVVLDESEVLGSLPIFEQITFIIAIVSLLLFPMLFFKMRRIIIHPLHKLSSAMLRLRGGDMEYRIGVHDYPREFLRINDTFNEMADNIQSLKIQQYEDQMERERLYVRNLELQIRPHFLINTFNLMFSLSQRDDREHLENTIIYLSDYFRHIFRNGQKLASFAVELDLIKSYIEIAKLRFPGEFEIDYDIAEEAMGFKVPPLLVHNFVENVMRHALVHGKTVHILLSAFQTEDNMGNVIIEDDGAGMPAEVVEMVNSGELNADRNDFVGLANSYQRIKFFLGSKASLHVDSENGNGCKVTIRFPLIEQTEGE